MDKNFILNKLEKNEEDHEKIGAKIEAIKDTMNSNHLELISAIHSNKVETERLKTRYGLYGVGLGSIPLVADFLIKNFK